MNDFFKNLKKDYNKCYDTFCFQNCLKILLGGLGIENAEYYINKSMSFIVNRLDTFELDYEFGIHARSLLPQFDNKVVRLIPEYDYKRVFEENIKYVHEHDPIIVGVDTYYLSYLPYYLKSHGKHAIILTGYNENDHKVEIVDWMEPWYYKGYISDEEFLNARNSQNESDGGMFAGSPVNNNWTKVIDKNGWDATLSQIIRYTIELSLVQYYHPKKLNDVFCGIDALIYIKGMIANLEYQPIEIQAAFLDELHRAFFRLNRRREFWMDFLSNIYKCDGYINPNDILLLLDGVINQNEKWIYRLIKCKMRKKPGYSEDLSNGLDQIIEMEIRIGEMLYSYATNIIV